MIPVFPFAWATVACAVVALGRLCKSERMMQVGAIMVLMTCAFAVD